ncbi:MAG: hypothetical protein HY675_15525 [Chloroflexi bacterium]|nr:hypothetical protein [Chloroflexota bacterium]
MRMTSRNIRRLGPIVASFAVIVLLTGAVVPLNAVPRDRVLVAGDPYFLAGVNYPWRTYQDFGTGAWGHSGISAPTTRAEVETDFANMAARGVRVVKWRIFNDGRYSPEFDEQGYVTGLDDMFFEDVDAALEIAEKYDIYLVFTLFSSGLWISGCEREGVRFGGHADVLADAGKRRSLVQEAVIPFLRHVGRNPRVLAYEIIAEPEWGIVELNPDEDGRVKVPLAGARALIKDIAQAVHFYSGALATVESNRARHMRAWRGLDLDYYTFSWYDWLEPYDPLDQPASAHGVDRPVVIGEFPVAESKYYDLEQVLEIAKHQGYAGAFGWSYWGGDHYGQFNEVSERYVAWMRDNWRQVNVGRGPLPEPGAPLLPLPYTAFIRQLAGSGDRLSLEVEVQIRDGGDYRLQFFLQELGNQSYRTLVERETAFGPNGAVRFKITFLGLEDARPYKINLGLFDATWNLRKWFDGLTIVYMEGGSIAPPDLSPQALEDPCYEAKR